jgi:hypothetical protein
LEEIQKFKKENKQLEDEEGEKSEPGKKPQKKQ